MTPPPARPPTPLAWSTLRTLTAARIGLPRTGASLATPALLQFRLAHAQARDAVHAPLDEPALRTALKHPLLTLDSAAPDRRTYLLRPDLGRQLTPESLATLAPHAASYDLAIVLGDGLSPVALQRHAPPLLHLLLPRLTAYRLAPLTLIRNARVATADHVAIALGATAVLILIGERPGLSAPDSLGAYLTWNPTPSTTDANRNCISNIRPEGLPFPEATHRLTHLLTQMHHLRLSGVVLKDDSALPPPIPQRE